MSDCWIYKAYHCLNDGDVLLYVGISDSPSDRMSQHGNDKWWWHLVNRLEWFRLESRKNAVAAESSAIERLKPIFNRQQSTLTPGSRLLRCLQLVRDGFIHCPLCLSACRHSEVEWEAKWLCTVDIGEADDAYCFDVRLSCSKGHAPVEWTQLIPVDVLVASRTKMPEEVLAAWWQDAYDGGEVGDDIADLRPPTLAEMFAAHQEPLLVGVTEEATDGTEAR